MSLVHIHEKDAHIQICAGTAAFRLDVVASNFECLDMKGLPDIAKELSTILSLITAWLPETRDARGLGNGISSRKR